MEEITIYPDIFIVEFIILFIFAYLLIFRGNSQKYGLVWLSNLGLLFGVYAFVPFWNEGTYMLFNLAVVTINAWGVSLFLGDRYSKGWFFATIACAGWIIGGGFGQFPVLLLKIPPTVFASVITVFAATRLITPKNKRTVGKTFTAIMLVLTGVYYGSFAFIDFQFWYDGFNFSIMLGLVIGVSAGFVGMHLERTLIQMGDKEKALAQAKIAAEVANRAKDEFLAHMTDALFIVDVEGHVKGSNRSAVELFGYEDQDLAGIGISEIIIFANQDPSILKSGTIRDLDLHVRHKNGALVPVTLSKSQILDAKKEIDFSIYTFSDRTGKIRAQENMKLIERLTEADQLKNNIITWASHELKTPLTPVYGLIDLMYIAKKSGKSLDQLLDASDVESLHRNTERLLKILDSFLDVGRLQSGALEMTQVPVSLTDICELAIAGVQFHATQKDIKIMSDLQSIEVTGDGDRLEQVVANILTNSIKYSPAKTTVYVETDLQNSPNGREKQAIIRIRDQGYGFTPEELQFAYKPFAKVYTQQDQKKYVPGTGVGLYLSKMIIEAHRGTLRIMSPGPDQGATVEICLPC